VCSNANGLTLRVDFAYRPAVVPFAPYEEMQTRHSSPKLTLKNAANSGRLPFPEWRASTSMCRK
jgi:hypothetical protein